MDEAQPRDEREPYKVQTVSATDPRVAERARRNRARRARTIAREDERQEQEQEDRDHEWDRERARDLWRER